MVSNGAHGISPPCRAVDKTYRGALLVPAYQCCTWRMRGDRYLVSGCLEAVVLAVEHLDTGRLWTGGAPLEELTSLVLLYYFREAVTRALL